MPRRGEVVAGLSISLTGAFESLGCQALNGLTLWVQYVREQGGLPLGSGDMRLPVHLVVRDDASRADAARDNVVQLMTEDHVDLLIGPYSSGLTRAVAPVVRAHGKALWNHGGATDAMPHASLGHVVSVPSPASDYLRALPRWARQRYPGVAGLTVLHAQTGTFARQVAHGLVEAATAQGFQRLRLIPFDSPIRNAPGLLHDALRPTPDILVGVGSFRDDVALARQRRLLRGVQVVAVVAAGVDAFSRELKDLAEGVIGPSQWEPHVSEPPVIGPDSAWFCTEYGRTFRQAPDYPAAQAFALGVVIMECLRRAGTLDDLALLRVARALDTTTLYGRFRLDPSSSRQVGHGVLLVQWRAGRKVVVSS